MRQAGQRIADRGRKQAVQEAFIAQGLVAAGGTPAELDQLVKTGIAMWKSRARRPAAR